MVPELVVVIAGVVRLELVPEDDEVPMLVVLKSIVVPDVSCSVDVPSVRFAVSVIVEELWSVGSIKMAKLTTRKTTTSGRSLCCCHTSPV